MREQSAWTSASPVGPSAAPTAIIVSTGGVRHMADVSELRELAAAGKFFWIDVVGGDEAERGAILRELGVEEPDAVWAQRFGQAGRMMVGRHRLRAVTWLSEQVTSLTEIHLLCTRAHLLTVWNGDAGVLDGIREHFAERASELEKSPYQAAGILLQLLLGTLHHAISELDARLQGLGATLRQNPASINFGLLAGGFQKLQSAWSKIDRYSSAVGTAIVGVEALPGVDERAADELNDYADQVQDLEHRLQERNRWASDIMQDYATEIAQRQGEQINRLTLVSLIFLPITFLTGFFGMNFSWMIEALGSPVAFVALGLLLPAVSVLLTVLWIRRRGLV